MRKDDCKDSDGTHTIECWNIFEVSSLGTPGLDVRSGGVTDAAIAACHASISKGLSSGPNHRACPALATVTQDTDRRLRRRRIRRPAQARSASGQALPGSGSEA